MNQPDQDRIVCHGCWFGRREHVGITLPCACPNDGDGVVNEFRPTENNDD